MVPVVFVKLVEQWFNAHVSALNDKMLLPLSIIFRIHFTVGSHYGYANSQRMYFMRVYEV